MKTIVIDRSKWRTGDEYTCATGKGYITALKNNRGYKCCLGFIAEAHGAEILGRSYPRNTEKRIPFLSWYNKNENEWVDTELALEAAKINDSDLPLDKKEKKLRQLFKGKYKLKFVGEPVLYRESE